MAEQCSHMTNDGKCSFTNESCSCRQINSIMECARINRIKATKFDTAMIVGSRSFTNYRVMKDTLDWLFENNREDLMNIISGKARGADELGARYANDNRIDLIEMSADWSIGRSAGFERNRKMHERLCVDDYRICIAFWDGKSHGTRHNFELCRKYNTPCVIFYFDPKTDNCAIKSVQVI